MKIILEGTRKEIEWYLKNRMDCPIDAPESCMPSTENCRKCMIDGFNVSVIATDESLPEDWEEEQHL